jgi:hypothetical protein
MLAGIDGVVIEPMDLMSAPSIEQGAPTSVWSAGQPAARRARPSSSREVSALSRGAVGPWPRREPRLRLGFVKHGMVNRWPSSQFGR